MPIDTKHPDYKEYEKLWEKCEAFVEGEEEVKEAGTTYLPRLDGQTNSKYVAYKNRALFYNAASRTVAALVGAVFRKEPSIKLPSKLDYLRSDATGTGVSLVQLAVKIATELMITGRLGLLADKPSDGGNSYIVFYDADDVLNWDITSPDKFVVLEENLFVQGDDKYDIKETEGFRELVFDASGYSINIWANEEISKGKHQINLVNTITPLKNGRTLDYIPFTCVTPGGLDFEVVKPPILDLINIQHKHYCQSADYANALHVIACPTPVVSGLKPEENFVLNLGPDAALILPEPASKAYFLEFTGQGVKPLEDSLTKLENMLAALGARLIETKRSSVADTAEAVKTREAVATAILSQILAATEDSLTKILKWIADWDGVDSSGIEVKLNRELISTAIDANMHNSLIQAVQAGTMSFETYYHILEEAGLTDPGVSMQDEVERIKTTKEMLTQPAVQPSQNM